MNGLTQFYKKKLFREDFSRKASVCMLTTLTPCQHTTLWTQGVTVVKDYADRVGIFVFILEKKLLWKKQNVNLNIFQKLCVIVVVDYEDTCLHSHWLRGQLRHSRGLHGHDVSVIVDFADKRISKFYNKITLQ